tara:strand:- start:846 stop:1193 length:348 start_codon:yes stop_codon:yes gene_type:complete
MKTKLIATLIALFFLSFTSKAGIPEGKKSSPISALSLSEQISQNIDYPSFSKLPLSYEKISLKFYISENFELKIKEIDADNEQLKEYVEQQLKDLVLNTDSGNINHTYSINLIFN